jgi:hypothetical protein
MKNSSSDPEDDDLRPEYDLSKYVHVAERGKYAEQYRTGTNLVLLAPDVAAAFPSDEAVNEALRLVMRLALIPAVHAGDDETD